MFKNLPDNIRIPIVATAPLLGILVLFVIVGKFGFSKISEVRLSAQKAAKDENVLSQKLEVLNAVDETIENDVNILTSTLPYANPALIASSQVKLIAGQNAVIVYGLKSGAESVESNLSKVLLNFEVVGTREGVFEFMKKLQLASPLMLIEKVKISEAEGEVRSTIALKSYWGALPAKLPALTDQINGLTTEEENLVSEILTYQQPVFVVLSAEPDSGKTDPFIP